LGWVWVCAAARLDLEADGKKSKDELDAEVAEVSKGVGSHKRKPSLQSVGSASASASASAPSSKRTRTATTRDVSDAKGQGTGAGAGAGAGDSSQKPVCFYGSKCYQKNAWHLSRFAHPPPTAKGAGDDEDMQLEELKEQAQAAKLEARVVRALSGSEEAKQIDAKLAEVSRRCAARALRVRCAACRPLPAHAPCPMPPAPLPHTPVPCLSPRPVND
jgi:hypothetical protein